MSHQQIVVQRQPKFFNLFERMVLGDGMHRADERLVGQVL